MQTVAPEARSTTVESSYSEQYMRDVYSSRSLSTAEETIVCCKGRIILYKNQRSPSIIHTPREV